MAAFLLVTVLVQQLYLTLAPIESPITSPSLLSHLISHYHEIATLNPLQHTVRDICSRYEEPITGCNVQISLQTMEFLSVVFRFSKHVRVYEIEPKSLALSIWIASQAQLTSVTQDPGNTE
ncbi:hypothetical protein EDD86DRAFT_245482 [Gorgonomyces haynaldii]|nr:hypothetical protein EDD86DRAFT_245482 [Gorgonomyces haynaldii]